MAYEINKTDGTVLVNIQEGEVDSTYGLNLLGKNYLGYGDLIAENFVRLLENFASQSEPANPIEGQLWFSIPPEFSESVPYQLKVWSMGTWKPMAHMFVGDSTQEPGFAQRGLGDLWYDQTAGVKSMKYWNGYKWVSISPLVGEQGYETGFIVDEKIKDTAGNFHPCIKIYVFGVLVAVISSDAEYTPHADENLSSFLGADTVANGDHNQSNTIAKGLNMNASGEFKLRGVAVEAEFADVAEIYVGDAAYEPGTLVGLGGDAEVTATKCDADTTVFGVVSTRPAYLMNARKKNVKNALPIAVAGRIPVKVKGIVNKGDRLVASDEPGVARRATERDPYWSIVGRALSSYDGESIGKVEATVGVK